jgi:hypothetical protein
MKLKKIHLFLIIIGALLLGSLGFTIKEGLETIGEYDIDAGDAASTDLSKDNDYVLKSSIVPPVCPKCPQQTACPRPKPCPACPAPKRCPEPAFECKKVPNYSSSRDPSNLPLPMLNSFSQF